MKITFRKLLKHRDYTLLNILGLGLSVGCVILIFLLLKHHFSFDQHHRHGDRILRVVTDVKTESIMQLSGVPNPMGKVLREECPLVEKVAMRSGQAGGLVSVANASGGKDKYLEEENFAWVEPEYFEILEFEVLQGTTRMLSEPNTVALTERMAQKFFGGTDVLGKTFRLNNLSDLRVVAVLKNLPLNTDYPQQILGSWATLKTIPDEANFLDSWGGVRGDCYCFALLNKGASGQEMEKFLSGTTAKYPHPESKDLFSYHAVPMLGLHFDEGYGFSVSPKFLWAMGLIGLFLLITACVNFINMATAQALTRAREVGVRKSLGSSRGQLFWQFMAETGLIVLLSLLFGLLLAKLALPYLNTWMDENLAFDADAWLALALFLPAIGVLLTFLSGFYPGWMQARFQPSITLKANSSGQRIGGFPLRKVLVTTQFAISQILIISAAVVTFQMQYAQDADWGFRPGAILTLNVPENNQKNSLKQELSQLTGVKSVSLCFQPPAATTNNQTGIQYENRPEPEPWIVNNKAADANYLETFGLKLVAGRNLLPSDTVREYLVNETFVKKLNLGAPEEILNKRIKVGQFEAPVVGVVRDYHNWAISQPISAIAMFSFPDAYSTCAVQLNPGNPAPVLAQIKQIWERYFPEHFYEQQFMDDQLSRFMDAEITALRMVRTFAGIAIFIGCLGLYGLAAFMIERKRKEIGVRKTLGATIPGLLWLFGKEYAKMILMAFVIAAPLAWWGMTQWLADYAYRIQLGVGVFLVSLLTTALVAIVTVGFQSTRAALANPVGALRAD